MARPSDVDTKIISIRIPMSRYIDLLNEAVQKRLSLSELITLYLFPKITKKKEKEESKPKPPAEEKKSTKGMQTTSEEMPIMVGDKYQVSDFLSNNGVSRFQNKLDNTKKGQSVYIDKYHIKNEGRQRVKVFA